MHTSRGEYEDGRLSTGRVFCYLLAIECRIGDTIDGPPVRLIPGGEEVGLMTGYRLG